ncbi:MAG: endolytic transglycosylase MltG [bacterium]|nr:endolytic transglycosylase MltG [bacterium]
MSLALKIGVGLLLILVLLGVFGGYLLTKQLAPVDSSNQNVTRFVVPKGQAVTVTANKLAEAGLIRQPLAFRIYVRQQGMEQRLQAGSFELSSSMTVAEVARELTTGTNDLWVTIPEGWRREEIAESLERQDLEAYDKTEFLTLTATSEGKLFPETYLLSRQSSSSQIANLLLRTFESNVTQGLATEIRNSQYSLDNAVVMASLLEREANSPQQMREVAGILWHRVEIGMPLQVDATFQYAKGYSAQEKSWWPAPLAADKTIVSPFNTYLIVGLPPKPIANPGADAVKAALNPIKTTNLYYIHDSSGQLHPAATLEGHNSNINRYLR